MKEPNFKNLLKILECKTPDRPTLFEFFLNDRLYRKIAGKDCPPEGTEYWNQELLVKAFYNAGYDYATIHASDFTFARPVKRQASTLSLNDGACITDTGSFEAYEWMDPDSADYSHLDFIEKILPEGMKAVICGPSGVLENTINLVGYDNLCLMMHDDPELAGKIFNEVGGRLLRTYEKAAGHDAVGAIIGNDDWGFRTQTMLSPADMRKYVFPWHKKIVAAAHKEGKPAILHSCGNLSEVMDDVINDMKYDGKHSYEDTIQPVEDAYEELAGRIAVMGGIDLDFLCRQNPEAIKKRCTAMLERSRDRGGFALGSGNSIPDYVPHESYFAMTGCVN